MTLAQEARDFRTLTDEQYADVLNGRTTAAEAVAAVTAERQEKAERIADSTGWIAWPGVTLGQIERVHAAMTAAALAALTGKENA